MKKIFMCALLILTFSLTGCAEKEQSNNNTNENNQQNEVANNQGNNVQENTNNSTQQNATNDNVHTANVDISIKDWVESVTIDGIKWTEFSETDVTEVFGNLAENQNTENTHTIAFTDVNGQEYTGTILHEETREDEIILRYTADNEAEDFAVRFELEKNNADNYILDGVRISGNGVASLENIMTSWGIDTLDKKAFEMVSNPHNSEDAEYSFSCTTDFGIAKIKVENDINDEGYKEVEVEVDFTEKSVPYSIDLLEVYEGNDSNKVKYFEIYIEKSDL